MRKRFPFEHRLGVALVAMLLASCAAYDELSLHELSARDEPCPDADADGVCDADDANCNVDGKPLACRRVAPPCPRGTVPEVQDGCYTDRCVSWDECVPCEARPSVPEDDPLHDRFEGTGLQNACDTDADCFVGGCSGEVCAAQHAVTTCEVLPYGPIGGCGCIEGMCVWNTRECAPEPECRVDEDCPEGQLCVEGLCVESSCGPEPTVPAHDPFYDRFEGTDAANDCETDADCVISGCSSEVCAAEYVATTCELLPYGPEGSCGCVTGQCIWNADSCDGGRRARNPN